jgi:hypothetical protein
MIFNSPTISGSLTVTGNIITSGSITISGSIASASYASTASYWSGSIVNALSASYAASSTTAANAILHNGTASAQFATTGSNTFTGNQYVSATTVPNGFSGTTAAVYTDGGMQVTKNAYFSSSLFVKGDLIIFGSQSVSYITSSQLNIADNIITVNTATPLVRFGGIAVQDSGSLGSGLTGSLLWDSQNNTWIYTNPSGSSYDGGMVLMGPPNYSSTGNEVGITVNALAKGAGSHHMTSSAIFDVSGSIGIGTNAPNDLLQVGSPTTRGAMSVWGTSTGAPVIQLNNTSATGGKSYNLYSGNAATGSFSIYDVSSSIHRLVIDSSGNVGMGTTSPSSKLEVNGGSILTNSSFLVRNGSYSLETGNIGSGSYIQSYVTSGTGNADLYFYTGVSERMRITSGGSVSIGNTQGNSTFTVSEAVSGNPTREFNVNTGTSGIVRVFAYNRNTGGIPLCLNDPGGNVGIGTTSPSYTLDVLPNSSTFVARIRNLNTTTDNAGLLVQAGVNAGNEIALFKNAAGTDRMGIYANGNVGIGTISPGYTLDVNGSAQFSISTYQKIQTYYSSPYTSGFKFSDLYGSVIYDAGNDVMNINTYKTITFSKTSGSQADTMRITENSNLLMGAGTGDSTNLLGSILMGVGNAGSGQESKKIVYVNNYSSATSMPQFVGNWMSAGTYGFGPDTGTNDNTVRVGQVTSNSSGWYFSGTYASLKGAAFPTTSDYRIKTNVVNSVYGLNEVLNLRPVKYNQLIQNENGEKIPKEKAEIGFIAHEVQEIIPEVVSGIKDEIDNNGNQVIQSLEYSRLIPVLVKAIQELKAQNDDLQSQINELKA